MTSKIPTFADIGAPILYWHDGIWRRAVIFFTVDDASSNVSLADMTVEDGLYVDGVPHMSEAGQAKSWWRWPDEAA